MRAIRVRSFGPPEALSLEVVPDPVPGPGEVVVKLFAIGVNPVDTYIRSGDYLPTLSLPYTPGLDGAGTIAQIGAGVKHRVVGQRVYVTWSLSGTYAEQVLCKESQTHPLPVNITFAQGAAIGVPYGAAFRALFQKADARAAETVLVHGASGGVGLAAVQLARAAGLTVIGTAGTEEGCRQVLEQGAHYVLNHRLPKYIDEVHAITGKQGVDVILEMLANVNLANDLRVIGPDGRLVVIGSRGTIEIDPRAAMSKEAKIFGMTLYKATEKDQTQMHAAFFAGLENGTLRPVVSKEFPLAHAAEAHHAVMESSTMGKLVLVP